MTEPPAVTWAVPEPPLPPLERPTLAWYDDAFVTRFSQGPIPTYDHRPLRFVQGAVYDGEDRLVASSQKLGGIGGNRHLAADPVRITRPRRPRTLSGTWLYGGHWNQHFGHFMVETITTLWPRERDVDGIVFHNYFGGPTDVEDWMAFFLTELGFGSVPVRIVGKSNGLAAERLGVPGRAVVSHAFAHPEAREVWEQVARRFRGPAHRGRVYLSRTRFHEELRRTGQDSTKRVRTDVHRDRALDALFAAAGFDVVAPETLPIAEQVALVADADTIAGSSGSALHLSAFARAGTRVLELGDARSPHEPLAMQRLVSAACDQPLAFVPLGAEDQVVLDLLAGLPGLPELPEVPDPPAEPRRGRLPWRRP